MQPELIPTRIVNEWLSGSVEVVTVPQFRYDQPS